MSSSAAPVEALSGDRRKGRFYLSAWLPVLLAILCIALESQPFFGADHTNGPLRQIVEWFTGRMGDHEWEKVHMVIRKGGHFSGYGLVSFTWFRAFWKTYRTGRERAARKWTSHLLAMLGTLMVASADEFHQTFLPNRTGTPVDVLIDCLGALLVQLVIFLVMLKFFRADQATSLSR